MNIVLWIIQSLLALAFLLVGFMRAFMPTAKLEKYMDWVKALPAALVRFIGLNVVLLVLALLILVGRLTFAPTYFKLLREQGRSTQRKR